MFFVLLYRPDLHIPRDEVVKNLDRFDIWNVVPSKRFLYEAFFAFVILILTFFIVPPDVVPPAIIALTIGMILVLLGKMENLNEKDVLDHLDFELLLYLFGIFVISGGLEFVGVIAYRMSVELELDERRLPSVLEHEVNLVALNELLNGGMRCREEAAEIVTKD